MLRAPIWITSATSSTASRSRMSISSVTIGRPVSALRLGEQPQPLLTEPLERVRGGARLVGAAAEQRRAGVAHDARGLERLLARLDRAGPGDQREVVAADLAPLDIEHGALAVGDLRGGELVGLEDRHDAVDARLALEPEALDAGVLLDVADRADHGHARARAAMGARAGSLDLLNDRLDLLGGRGLLHHDHHRLILSLTPGISGADGGRCDGASSAPGEVALGPNLRDPVRPPEPAHARARAEAPR